MTEIYEITASGSRYAPIVIEVGADSEKRMQVRRKKLEEYSNLVERIAYEIIQCTTYWGGTGEPLGLAHEHDPEGFERLEKICAELKITMPFREPNLL
jgi:hypothetical protein